MLNCPLCGSDLTRSGLNDDRCPFCGGLLLWEDAEQPVSRVAEEDPSSRGQDPPPRPAVVEDEVLSIRQFVATYLLGSSPDQAEPSTPAATAKPEPSGSLAPSVPATRFRISARIPPRRPAVKPARPFNRGSFPPRSWSRFHDSGSGRSAEESMPRMTLKSDAASTAVGGDCRDSTAEHHAGPCGRVEIPPTINCWT